MSSHPSCERLVLFRASSSTRHVLANKRGQLTTFTYRKWQILFAKTSAPRLLVALGRAPMRRIHTLLRLHPPRNCGVRFFITTRSGPIVIRHVGSYIRSTVSSHSGRASEEVVATANTFGRNHLVSTRHHLTPFLSFGGQDRQQTGKHWRWRVVIPCMEPACGPQAPSSVCSATGPNGRDCEYGLI